MRTFYGVLLAVCIVLVLGLCGSIDQGLIEFGYGAASAVGICIVGLIAYRQLTKIKRR